MTPEEALFHDLKILLCFSDEHDDSIRELILYAFRKKIEALNRKRQ